MLNRDFACARTPNDSYQAVASAFSARQLLAIDHVWDLMKKRHVPQLRVGKRTGIFYSLAPPLLSVDANGLIGPPRCSIFSSDFQGRELLGYLLVYVVSRSRLRWAWALGPEVS